MAILPKAPLEIDRLEGQVVIAPATEPWFFAAYNVTLSVLSATNTFIGKVQSEAGGRYRIPGLSAGRYTILVEHPTLQPFRLLVQVAETKKNPARGLLTTLTLPGEKRASTGAILTDLGLRQELLDRVETDQAIRNSLIQRGIEHPDKALLEQLAQIDRDNTQRMLSLIQRTGWPGLDRVGVDGSEAAFLLVQYAPHAVQKELLPVVENAYRGHQLPGEKLALILDRVLLGDGKPQRYGTQAKAIAAWKDKNPVLEPIEDEANVDKRRAALGMRPLADYVKSLKELYVPPK